MIVGIVSFLAMGKKKLQIKFDDESKKLILDDVEYTVLAFLLPSSLRAWLTTTVQVLLKDEEGNLRQETLKLGKLKFVQFQFFVQNTQARYYSREEDFNRVVSATKNQLSSAHNNTAQEEEYLPLQLRFV